ncbi:hypothetical protein [Virgibacillus ihumii]|uniref:hypothetical protein n=1 Tax=Virgibacillus ihumii TaxID=2686091 RepID=UPI00157C61A1|nr:hypothetical protein [Virgibacillus ihumii]
MEAIPFVAAFIPLIIMCLIYIGILALIIWFAITFIKTQKERNTILQSISDKLDYLEKKHTGL